MAPFPSCLPNAKKNERQGLSECGHNISGLVGRVRYNFLFLQPSLHDSLIIHGGGLQVGEKAVRLLRRDGGMSGFQEVLASKADSELIFQFFAQGDFYGNLNTPS